MKIDDIKNIAIIGAGNMGHQISLHCAIKGYNITCTDISEEMLEKANSFVDKYLPGRVAKGKMTEDEAKAVRGRIRFTNSLEDAVKDADYVIEAAIEVLDVKRKLFVDIDKMAPAHAILATNSSAIVSSKVADATNRPEKVVNLHFFNPALVMKLVEVVQGEHVSEETARISMDLCEKLDKVPVHVKKEVKGFLLNRIFGALGKEALWLLDMGVASAEDIDKACMFGAGHPMGPFTLMDLTGIDLAYTMDMETFKETGDPATLPSPSVVEHYVKGEYGQKSGKGWYDYTKK
ncbi:MAG: 3-hydroxyacyl-CoA dehydrogenase family protein [Deltaproteobacteria bacterium]|uniref:3-hydroxyacyl-CoA dehydrogenase family protein n=1 Tax=Desulfobacula sp. TaxID=2593537 RepID=UPI0019CD6933|nr:3-hydroxyacyl-CoA dehydrogenase family protein [Candidatus Desulfobacula maris]MBL6992929.1 3-hydroxyacyl-CoA dehydrogenase family protein [Desulfobacula sp.]